MAGCWPRQLREHNPFRLLCAVGRALPPRPCAEFARMACGNSDGTPGAASRQLRDARASVCIAGCTGPWRHSMGRHHRQAHYNLHPARRRIVCITHVKLGPSVGDGAAQRGVRRRSANTEPRPNEQCDSRKGFGGMTGSEPSARNEQRTKTRKSSRSHDHKRVGGAEHARWQMREVKGQRVGEAGDGSSMPRQVRALGRSASRASSRL